ncbi:MAG: DUF885 domain-containing protein [Gammaproteobacteria bacterium]
MKQLSPPGWLISGLILVVIMAPIKSHAGPEDDRFQALSDRYLDQQPAFSPIGATVRGDHRFDDQLDRVGVDARSTEIVFYIRMRADLADIETASLSRANQVDAALLRHELNKKIWTNMELEEWRWNPTVYTELSGLAVYGLMAREFAPVDARLMNVVARLEQLPKFFADVRTTLEPARVPVVHAETAIRQNPGVVSNIDNLVVPAAEALTGEQRRRLDRAVEVARSAVAEHQAWLEDTLLPNAGGEFRIGQSLYDEKLAFALNSPLDRTEIRRRAEHEYERVREAMYEVSKGVYLATHPYSQLPAAPDEHHKQLFVRAALEVAYAQLPGPDQIVETARESLARTTAFVREKNLVRVPDDPLEIIVMPEFRRGVSLAYCDSPGPLDKGQKTFYAVSPLPSDWSPQQVGSFLREYNLLSIDVLTIHEAMPGHFLQLAHSSAYPSTLRAVLRSGSFIEGWAVYTERVMTEAGFRDGDPLMHLMQLKWYLRAITNAIMDQAIHVDGMTRDQAMSLMIEGGFQEEREAAGKWVRAQLTSAQLATYFVGYQEHSDLRSEWEARKGDDFSAREYHDRVLSYGSPPGRYVRALMLDLPIPGEIDQET